MPQFLGQTKLNVCRGEPAWLEIPSGTVQDAIASIVSRGKHTGGVRVGVWGRGWPILGAPWQTLQSLGVWDNRFYINHNDNNKLHYKSDELRCPWLTWGDCLGGAGIYIIYIFIYITSTGRAGYLGYACSVYWHTTRTSGACRAVVCSLTA